MVYRVRDLIADCATGRGRLKLDKSRKREAYAQVWDCFCKWVVNQYGRGKGVFVPNFCRLGWEIVATMGGGNRQAPYFELTDHFCRSHGLPVKRKPNPLQRANEGEINFIKLAIKFSGSLTKDVVFSGTRDLFQRIGRIVASGQPMELDMKIGKLLGKERRVHFVFDSSQRESVIMRHPMEYKGRPLETNRSTRILSKSASLPATRATRRHAGNLAPMPPVPVSPVNSPTRGYGSPDHHRQHPQQRPQPFAGADSAHGSGLPPRPRSIGTGAGAGQMRGVPSLRMGISSAGAPPRPPDAPIPFDDDIDDDIDGGINDEESQGLSAPLGMNSDRQVQLGFQTVAPSHQKVLEDAFARHQRALIQQAENKARESEETEEAMWQQELENRRKRRIAQEQKRELQEYIKQQMKEQKERQRLERESWKSLAPAQPRALYATQEQLQRTRDFNSHLDSGLVPESSGASTGGGTGGVVHHNGAIISGPTMYDMDADMRPEVVRAREDLKSGLLHQITVKRELEDIEKARALEQERAYLEHVRMEAEEQRLFQKMKQQIAKRDLMTAWDRDIKLKEIVKFKETAGMRANRQGSSRLGQGIGIVPGAGDETPKAPTNVSLGIGLPPAPSARAGSARAGAMRGSARGFAGSSRQLPGGGGAYAGAKLSSRS